MQPVNRFGKQQMELVTVNNFKLGYFGRNGIFKSFTSNHKIIEIKKFTTGRSIATAHPKP